MKSEMGKPFKAKIKPLSFVRRNRGVIVSDMYEYCGKILNFTGKMDISLGGGKMYLCEVKNSLGGMLHWWWNDWHFDIIEEVDKKGNFLLEF